MDFGIARVLGAEQKTVDFRLMGTPAHTSRNSGKKSMDVRISIPSGALPSTRPALLVDTSLKAAAAPDSRHDSTLRIGELPDWCEAIVQQLPPVQADRFQSAEEFREARHAQLVHWRWRTSRRRLRPRAGRTCCPRRS